MKQCIKHSKLISFLNIRNKDRVQAFRIEGFRKLYQYYARNSNLSNLKEKYFILWASRCKTKTVQITEDLESKYLSIYDILDKNDKRNLKKFFNKLMVRTTDKIFQVRKTSRIDFHIIQNMVKMYLNTVLVVNSKGIRKGRTKIK